MSKKQQLANSFAGKSRKNRPQLSAEQIEQIVDRGGEVAETKAILDNIPSQEALTPKEPIPVKNDPVLPISKKKPTAKKSSKVEEVVVKTSLDMPEDLYEEMKIYLIRQKKSMREYLLDMIRHDLKRNNR